MIYIIIFLFLLFLSAIEYCTKDNVKREYLFYISSFLLFSFCTLHYKSGFDYGSYLKIYIILPDSLFENVDISSIKGEFLFKKFFILLKSINTSPPVALAVTYAITNLLFLRFIYKYSLHKCFSILILYSWYFVYIFNALRQGLAMGLFLGIAYPFLEQKKYINYYIVVLIATLFHTAAIITFIIPLLLNILRKASNFQIIILIIIAFVIAFIPNSLLRSMAESVERGEGYLDTGISYFALINRILAFAIIFVLYNNDNEKSKIMMRIYVAGLILYLCTAQSELIAARLGAVFKSFDIVLIPYILKDLQNKARPMFMVVMYIYLGLIFMHLLSGMAFSSGFYDVWDYPYKSLFGKDYYYDNW